MLDYAVSTFVTLFIVVDPLALGLIFIALMEGASHREQVRLALKASLCAFFVLVVFAFFGAEFIAAIGVSLIAIRIAGGIMLFLLALEMLFEKRSERRNKAVQDRSVEVGQDEAAMAMRRSAFAIFPIAVPLMAGPSAMTTVILYSGTSPAGLWGQVVLTVMIALVCLISFAILSVAPFIFLRLGQNMTLLLTRIFALMLAAMSVQFILNGIEEFVRQFDLIPH